MILPEPSDADRVLLQAPPPSDVDAERALLGCLLLDGDSTFRAAAERGLATEHFYLGAHRIIWGAAVSLARRAVPVDSVTLVRHLEDEHLLGDVALGSGRTFLQELALSVTSASNASAYADIVRRKAACRDIIRAGYEIAGLGRNGLATSEALSIARQQIDLLAASTAAAYEEDTLRPFTALTDVPADVPWLIRGYLVEGGVSLLSGPPKVGKSALAYAMAAALERGDPEWCGCAVVGPAECVILSEEDDGPAREKAARFGLATSLVLTARMAYPRRPLAQDVDLVLRAAKRNPRIKAMVVDTWRFWASLPDKAENDSGAVSKAFSEVRRAAAAGLGVLLLHHTRKSGGEDGTAAAGSNALVGAADIILEIGRFGGAGGNARALKAWGRYERIPEEVVVELKEGRYRMVGDAGTARDNLREERVLGVVAGLAKWSTTDEVAEATGGMKRAGVIAALAALHGKGKIQKVGGGVRGSPGLFAPLGLPLHTAPKPPGA